MRNNAASCAGITTAGVKGRPSSVSSSISQILPREQWLKADRIRRADPDEGSHPRSRFAVMNERQHWMQRLDDFIAYLRDELQREPTTWQQYESAVRRWIDFVLPLGHDPAEFNQLFVDNFLDQQGDLTVSSRHG